MRDFKEGRAEAGGRAACSFIIPLTGSHWTARASAPDAPDGGEVQTALVLVGQSGETELFSGPLGKSATLIELPVTLPGERLVLRPVKPARIAFDIAWIEHGPTEEVDLCAR